MFRWAHVRVPVNSTQKLSPDCLQNSSSTATAWHSNKQRFAQLRVHVHLPGCFRSCSIQITKNICISRYGFEFIELTLCYLQIPKKKVYFRACICVVFLSGTTSKICQCLQDLCSKQRGKNSQLFGESSAGEESEARYGWVGAISIRQR